MNCIIDWMRWNFDTWLEEIWASNKYSRMLIPVFLYSCSNVIPKNSKIGIHLTKQEQNGSSFFQSISIYKI